MLIACIIQNLILVWKYAVLLLHFLNEIKRILFEFRNHLEVEKKRRKRNSENYSELVKCLNKHYSINISKPMSQLVKLDMAISVLKEFDGKKNLFIEFTSITVNSHKSSNMLVAIWSEKNLISFNQYESFRTNSMILYFHFLRL